MKSLSKGHRSDGEARLSENFGGGMSSRVIVRGWNRVVFLSIRDNIATMVMVSTKKKNCKTKRWVGWGTKEKWSGTMIMKRIRTDGYKRA